LYQFFVEVLYRSRVACQLARISQRTLDYWVETRLVRPRSVYRGPNQRRDFFLFGFEELLRLQIISALRRTGLSLQRVRAAVATLDARGEAAWKDAWLVADAEHAYLVHEPQTLETLTGKHAGQLAFTIVAVGTLEGALGERLARADIRPFPLPHHRGSVLPFVASVA
jgi:DNA-binding transcriptional MerR regulator